MPRKVLSVFIVLILVCSLFSCNKQEPVKIDITKYNPNNYTTEFNTDEPDEDGASLPVSIETREPVEPSVEIVEDPGKIEDGASESFSRETTSNSFSTHNDETTPNVETKKVDETTKASETTRIVETTAQIETTKEPETTSPPETVSHDTEPKETEPPDPPEPQFTESGYYFGMLNNTEKKYYTQILEAMQKAQTDISVKAGDLTSDSTKKIITSIRCDHPEIFWYDSAKTYSRYTNGPIINIELSYNELLSQRKSIESKLTSTANQIKKTTKSMSDFEKEKYIHDFLVENCSYVINGYDQNIYSALVLQKTVCAGYSRAFQYLCNENGLETLFVMGNIQKDGKKVAHAWNLIKLDGEWYAVDVTSDDFSISEYNGPIYTFFNFIEDETTFAYTRENESKSLPVPTGRKYTIQAVYGVSEPIFSTISVTGIDNVIYSLEEYQSYFYELIDSNNIGTYTFDFIIADSNVLDEIEAWLDEGEYMDYLLLIISYQGYSHVSFEYSMSTVSFSIGTKLIIQTNSISVS